ncbi:Rz1-like lysis system protein LysC [Aeromonas veronii]|uniref:Rz1-like lysis system protein LysC n=1 Tax=Aeromonas veronii TaxID=654 RepID=UPI003C1301D3
MNRAALPGCLALLLCACANSPPPPLIKNEVVRLVPPASLTAPCPVPPLNLTTWGAVVEEDMPALIAALRACDIRMSALRQWATSAKEHKP